MSRISGSPAQFESWSRLADPHTADPGPTGSLARALATAVEMLTEPRVWMERISLDKVQVIDRLTSDRQIIVGSFADIVAHATVFAARRGGVIAMDVIGLDLAIAQAMEEDGIVEVVKTRYGKKAS